MYKIDKVDSRLINKVIKNDLEYKFSINLNQWKDKSDVHYLKLPYMTNLSCHIKNKLSKLRKEFCKESFNIKLVFSSFKIKNYFSYKDPIPNDLKSFLVYKFTCASCSSSYIGETYRHFKTRIEEHIKNNLALTLSLQLLSFLVLLRFFFLSFVVGVFFAFLFNLLFPLSLTLIIGNFYWFNYTSLLLHLITTHLVSHLSLSSIIYIFSTIIITLFTALITLRYYFISK